MFGLLKNNSIFPLFIQTGALVLLTVFAVPALFSGNTRPLIKLGVALMVSGAGENVLDRLIYGGVLDYLQFPKLKWIGKIVFDLADFFLLLGSLILVIVTVL